MATITVEEILEATGGKTVSHNSKTFNGVSIDSRTIEKGNIFFAIRGDRFDGHDFLDNALLKGDGAVVEENPRTVPEDKVIICVQDSLRSLQDLAHYMRMKREIPVIAVTGSNGKTTTKEMIHAIASKRFKALKNEGNLNNQIGLPLSLTKMQPDDEVIILEMGMNAAGEIRRLCEIAAPSHGVITNVGMAHIGRLGSFEAVRAAKLEILEGLDVVVVNADDSNLMDGIKNVKEFDGQVMTFAIDNSADIKAADLRATKSGSEFMLQLGSGNRVNVDLPVMGIFNVYNALAAAAVCSLLGVSSVHIKEALEEFRPFSMRFEIIRRQDITIINDSYNANPSSVKESLKELVHIGSGGRTVAVLGDMQELDEFSNELHRDIGKALYDLEIDVFVAVGDMMNMAAKELSLNMYNSKRPKILTFKNVDEAGARIRDYLQKNDTVLLKGSRIMSIERIIEKIPDAI